MKRLFFALWPDEKTRQKIVQFDQQLTEPKLKKVKTDNLHVTLVFLGQVDDEQQKNITEAVSDIKSAAIDLTFDQLTLWQQKCGILCLTSQYQPQSLLALVEQIRQRAIEHGVILDNRTYTAHITLARNLKQLPEVATPAEIDWHATSFALIHSVSTEHGVDYRVIKSWPLTA
ncbi:2'-5' RNA ligase [Methylophaga sp. 41_12_T18]|nr:2'-5' RNA ligase [Methylophaga sp. 41_12_T18]